jgi:hypothetical protein
MRLTLRTLLAHQDDILEPEDAAQIEQKIEESEFASGLVHRLKDVSQRLRLGAPPLEGRGMGLDPNVVAEYLDNALDAEQIPDFEKTCLESDVHLAEVASSHQILTLVLGEPAQVDPDSRKRMYELIENREAHVVPPPHADEMSTPPPPSMSEVPVPAGQPPVQSDGPVQSSEADVKAPPVEAPVEAPVKTSVEAPAEPKVRRKPEVPDYLREGAARSNRRWAVITLLIATAASVAIFLSFGGKEYLDQWLADSGDVSPPADINPDAPANEPTGDEKSNSAGKTAAVDPLGTPDVKPPITDEFPNDVVIPGNVTPPGANTRPDVIKLPDGPAPNDIDPPSDVKPSPKDVVPPEPKSLEPKIVRLGQLRSLKQPLLLFDPETKQWRRLPSKAAINSETTLLALPTFRPEITLGSLTVHLGGETMIQLEGPGESGVVGLRIIYGRVILLAAGGQESRLRVLVGKSHYELTINDADLALHVTPRTTAGVDPAVNPTAPQIDLYVTRGNILWRNADTGEQKQYHGDRHVAVAGPQRVEKTGLDSFPPWILEEELSPTERRASVTHVEPELDSDASVQLRLQEMAGHQRREIQLLAARCLGHIGEFDSFVEALNNADARGYWDIQIDSLLAAMARSPESAKLVREALKRHDEGRVDRLYPILWGYSEEGLRDGGAATLVGHLSHEKLIFRVLSSTMLKRITGLGGYSPEDTEAKRRSSVRRWTDRLESGRIVPKGASLKKKPAPKAAK